MEMQIQIENLDKYYGKKHALDHVNLTISQGMFGLLGRNGAGENYFDENSGRTPEETGRQSGDMRRPCGRPGKNPADDRLSPSGLFHVSQYDSV